MVEETKRLCQFLLGKVLQAINAMRLFRKKIRTVSIPLR